MRILVTGAAGFIGSNLAKHLAAEAHDVTAADAFLAAPYTNLLDFPGDILTLKNSEDIESMTRLGTFDAILHQASITGVVSGDGADLTHKSPSEQNLQHQMLRNNVETFRAILNWAVQTKARVVWASSCSIYGRGAVPMRESQPPDPLNIYAFSKLTMERLAKRYAPKLAHPIVALRYTNVYGPGEDHKGKLASMIHQLAKQMRGGQRPRIFSAGQQRRDFVYIDDVIQANIKSLATSHAGVFNIGAGKSWSFNEIVAELNRALKTNLQPDYFENPYAFTQDRTEADLTESRRCLGYEPGFDLARGIDAYLASGKLGN